MEKTCLQCGGFFIVTGRSIQQRFCPNGRKCVEAYRRAHEAPERTAYRAAKKVQYKVEGRVYKHKPRPPKIKSSYSAAVCICEECGTLFLSKAKKKRCGSECDRIRNNRRTMELWRQREQHPNLSQLQCCECGKEFRQSSRKQTKFCSDTCGTICAKRVRRVRERIAISRAVEEFGSWEIYRRDGYMCQICGDKLNFAVHHSHNYSPTLDHIIPLSKGGSHTRANVQAAHRFCNSLKSDKHMDSMFFAINGVQGGHKSLSV